MTKRQVRAWSYSALDSFINCPRQFLEVSVLKSVQQAQSQEMLWGNKVHKLFEMRIKKGEPLPDTLQEHEPLFSELEKLPGHNVAEQKVALDKTLKPCTYFAKNVWFRGVIDFANYNQKEALLVDYKTGKVKPLRKQLASFALYVFMEKPEIETVHTAFYWTKTKSMTKETWARDQIPEMWGMFAPDLKQWVEAFKTDTWQPRPSGLCYGWCPVTDCEHWKPKKG